MSPESSYLFTYGTLMQGFDNPFAEKLRARSTFEGNGYFHGRLYRVAWYPGAVYDELAEDKVYGEIYKLNAGPELIRELDEYEDVFENEAESLYIRRIVPIIMESEVIIPCWAYLYNKPVDQLTRVSEGRFRG